MAAQLPERAQNATQLGSGGRGPGDCSANGCVLLPIPVQFVNVFAVADGASFMAVPERASALVAFCERMLRDPKPPVRQVWRQRTLAGEYFLFPLFLVHGVVVSHTPGRRIVAPQFSSLCFA